MITNHTKKKKNQITRKIFRYRNKQLLISHQRERKLRRGKLQLYLSNKRKIRITLNLLIRKKLLNKTTKRNKEKTWKNHNYRRFDIED